MLGALSCIAGQGRLDARVAVSKNEDVLVENFRRGQSFSGNNSECVWQAPGTSCTDTSAVRLEMFPDRASGQKGHSAMGIPEPDLARARDVPSLTQLPTVLVAEAANRTGYDKHRSLYLNAR